jgi:predicted TIM-barrel fold metal-dependent hydrolase
MVQVQVRRQLMEDTMLTRRGMLHAAGATSASFLALRSGTGAAAPSTVKTPVDYDVPRGACDCHVHVFGDAKKFPFAADRVYTPPEASVDDLRALQAGLHFERVVIVTPSVYGLDNSCTLDAIRQLGPRARGVAVIDQSTPAAVLDEMAAGGFKGARLNVETVGEADPGAVRRLIDSVADAVRSRNWHLQFNTRMSVIAALKDDLAALGIPVVFDHFGRAQAALGTGQPGFDAMLDLLKSGHAYVKISAVYRSSQKAPDFPDVAPLAQAIVAANPDRVVWGSNWPHPGRGTSQTAIAPPYPADDGLMLNLLAKWVPDPAVRKKILVDNPARLYGFDTAA